eukprot:TRINITY_DN11373_c2_g4_i1.p1 TRINITY_DN11373_c2_g4~~TRINITY_DN11373_c2_g4_i1.p1  ORF type:complete len:885 (-),score=119.98 TRINITY_DN11373_c2_g4_i1:90-2654(-)
MEQLHVICLHGSSQDNEIFSQRLKGLRRRLPENIVLHFVDAPHLMPLREGQTVQMRQWWRPFECTGKAFEGWQESQDFLADFFVTAANSGNPLVGAIGFSQGASAACILGHLATKQDNPFSSLKFVVACGGALNRGLPTTERTENKYPIRSLHIWGEEDTLVPMAQSAAMANFFQDPQILQHSKGHCMPAKSGELNVIADFIKQFAPKPVGQTDIGSALMPNVYVASEYDITKEEQGQEVDALKSIYCDLFEELSECPPRFRIRFDVADLPAGADSNRLPTSIKFGFPPLYPGTPIVFELEATQTLAGQAYLQLLNDMKILARDLATSSAPAVYELVNLTRERLVALAIPVNDNGEDEEAEGDEGFGEPSSILTMEETDEERAINITEAMAKAAAVEQPAVIVDTSRNRAESWGKYVIGLVGKPSAGKSTFFNAAVNPSDDAHAARVGAFPFTTIEPNHGTGYYSIPCPCRDVLDKGEKCGAIHGHSQSGSARLLPVVLKDVAGLVPGACQGRGKGNRFLDDLTDADVLIHVVDVSGRTNREGVQEEGLAKGPVANAGDPVDEVAWVREEIHSWIFDNVRAKWDVIRRKPTKLLSMFSGYHAKEELVLAALQRAGVNPRDLSEVSSWGPKRLHEIVAHFLRVRFPVLLALNKADVEGASINVERVRQAWPNEAMIPVSARSETLLNQWRREGKVLYPPGERPEATGELCDADASRFATLEATVLGPFGTTGVAAALSTAVSLRSPLFVFPVTNVETCLSLPSESAPQAYLRDCVPLRPGSTVEDTYEVLKQLRMVEGNFVRAHGRGPDGKPVTLRKTELVTTGSVVQILTNKRAPWQQGTEHNAGGKAPAHPRR